MSRKPKVVAINGSPHGGAANTSMMIGMIQGNLEREGFELEQVFLSQHNIHYCYGCAVCLEKGSCWIKDDYRAIAEKMMAADVWVNIAQGKMDGTQAFMNGKYTVDGDVNLLMKLQSLFKRSYPNLD